MKNKSISFKGDLLLATAALIVVGGLCVKGAASFNKPLQENGSPKITLTIQQEPKI